MSADQFYTGLIADLYEPLKSTTQDPGRYADFIAQSGEPALELGCGDGDPLLELRRMGLDVEGVDSSADMLRRCLDKAIRLGIDVTLHHQLIESLNLTRRYRSIFLAGPTFTLLPDDATAARALRCLHDHLEPGGQALVPLFIPPPTPESAIGQVREHRATTQPCCGSPSSTSDATRHGGSSEQSCTTSARVRQGSIR